MSSARTSRPAGDWLSRLVLAVVGGVAFAAAVGVVLWRLGNDPPATSPLDVYGLGHVHGLGLNPADDSLIVATHNGTFRTRDDAAHLDRVGESLQDTMGFTVIGPDQFLASGHPDLPGRRAGQPPQLGLLESNDGGRTWTQLSLGGTADFHGLAAAHGQIYGWDASSSRFMVTRNRLDWDMRSTIELVSFAVDPRDDDHVIGSSGRTLVESGDGGRSWREIEGPPLIVLSWDAQAGLWGAGTSGTVQRYDGGSWSRVASLPGQPQAMAVTTVGIYAAAYDDQERSGLYRYDAAEDQWQLRYVDDS